MTASNWIALVAVVVAAFAGVIAGLARRDSKRSAQAAQRSAKAAEDSVALSERATAVLEAQRADQLRAAEAAAVVWAMIQHSPSQWELRNDGTEDAYNVEVSGQSLRTADEKRWPVVRRGESKVILSSRAIGLDQNVTVTWNRDGHDQESQTFLLL